MSNHGPDRNALRFGLRSLPPGVEAAWGARWIVDQDGWVDEVGDRTDAIGPSDRREQLLGYLDEHVGRQPQLAASRLLSSGELRVGEDRDVTLFRDDQVTVRANPKRSYGYLYVAAYFTTDGDSLDMEDG